MNVRSHDVIFERPLSIIKSIDELRFYVHFNCISVISGQWKGKHERPCAMKRCLASERISPSAGFEPETPWSDFESAKSSAMWSLLVRSLKQANVTLTPMPIIWIGTKTIRPFPICGLADGWGSGYNESVMFCFFNYFVQNRWYKWYKNHKNFIQHLVFITVDYAPVICNHPHPPYIYTQTEHSRDNGFSSITALGPAERHSPALYNNKFNGIYMHNITSPAAGELKRPMGERGGSVVECRTPEREVRGSRPTAAVLCPWARHFTPRKYWLNTLEAMAPSRHDWKIVDWDVKPQHNQPSRGQCLAH